MTAFFEIINGNAKHKLDITGGALRLRLLICRSIIPHYFERGLATGRLVESVRRGQRGIFKAFLGRMLSLEKRCSKKVNVLSGGEKMRCMIARMQLRNANCLILDTPTNHLDMECIQSFNNNLKTYKGNVLFSSHDHEFIETVANRIIELTPNGIIDKMMDYDEYITSDHIKEMRARMYGDNK